MTTLSFLGSRVSYQPTRIATPIRRTYATKYRGQDCTLRQSITLYMESNGLTYRGVTY